MKTVRVVAAVIFSGDGKKVFATARGYGEYKGGWEFPGGKIEPGETPEEALRREIKEELAADIVVGGLIDTIEYDYPAFHLSMDCFLCSMAGACTEAIISQNPNGALRKASLAGVSETTSEITPKTALCHEGFTLLEAADARWLSAEELYSVEWLPADLTIIDKIKKLL